MVFRDHAPRQLGLRRQRAAHAHRCSPTRQENSRGCAKHQAGIALHPRSPDRQADLRRGRTARRFRQHRAGDDPWPTQPFPIKPPPLTRNSFRLDEVATVTPEHEKFCKALLATEGGALGGGPYAQYGPKLRVILPELDRRWKLGRSFIRPASRLHLRQHRRPGQFQ